MLKVLDLSFGNLGDDKPFAKIVADLAEPSAKKRHFIGEIAKIAMLFANKLES